MPSAMRLLLMLVLGGAVTAAVAQEGRMRGHGPRWQGGVQAPAHPPHGAMSWEERQRFRDELKASREGPHKGWRGPLREAKRAAPPMSAQERERLRRDIHEANRDLQGRH